ncbi:MAG TPA: glycosyltransferase [Chitinispirillaceae bacterium]|nr:glycosyltransferase [Chitinispirillaceae bacterium]
MISVITCWSRPVADTIQEKNIAKTIGVDHQYIMVDGSTGIGLAEAYNQGLAHVKGDIVVLIPEDVLFMKPNWGTVLEKKFASDPWLGAVGVAGTQYLFAEKYSWTAAGRPFIKGRVVHHLENGDFFAVVFSPENGDFPVVAIDGVFMAIKSSILKDIAFDDECFKGNCFYDLDFCMQINHSHRLIVTTEIVLKRRHVLSFDKVWNSYGQQFLAKHAANLPVSCTDTIPDPQNFISSQVVNLKGKAPIETIC